MAAASIAASSSSSLRGARRCGRMVGQYCKIQQHAKGSLPVARAPAHSQHSTPLTRLARRPVPQPTAARPPLRRPRRPAAGRARPAATAPALAVAQGGGRGGGVAWMSTGTSLPHQPASPHQPTHPASTPTCSASSSLRSSPPISAASPPPLSPSGPSCSRLVRCAPSGCSPCPPKLHGGRSSRLPADASTTPPLRGLEAPLPGALPACACSAPSWEAVT